MFWKLVALGLKTWQQHNRGMADWLEIICLRSDKYFVPGPGVVMGWVREEGPGRTETGTEPEPEIGQRLRSHRSHQATFSPSHPQYSYSTSGVSSCGPSRYRCYDQWSKVVKSWIKDFLEQYAYTIDAVYKLHKTRIQMSWILNI